MNFDLYEFLAHNLVQKGNEFLRICLCTRIDCPVLVVLIDCVEVTSVGLNYLTKSLDRSFRCLFLIVCII